MTPPTPNPLERPPPTAQPLGAPLPLQPLSARCDWLDTPAVGAGPALLDAIDRAAPDDPRPLAAMVGGLAERPFDADPRTWSRAGWAALDAFLADAAPRLRSARRRLWLVPHHAHVLSDVPACGRFLKSLAPDAPFALLVDPAALVAPSMVGQAADAIRRVFEDLCPRAAAVLLRGADWTAPNADGERALAPAPLAASRIDPAALAASLHGATPPGGAWLLPDDAYDADARLLAAAMR